jgi:hypothetical protein
MTATRPSSATTQAEPAYVNSDNNRMWLVTLAIAQGEASVGHQSFSPPVVASNRFLACLRSKNQTLNHAARRRGRPDPCATRAPDAVC